MTRTLVFGSALACLLSVVACKRYEESRRGIPHGQPLGTAAPSLAPPPPGTSPPNCPPGYTANTYPAWCIKLPKGFSPSKLQVDGKNIGHVDYSPSPMETLRVTFTDSPMQVLIDQAWGMFHQMNWEQTGEGQLDGGRRWVEGHDMEGRGHFVVVAPGHPPFTIKCETTAPPNTDRYRRDVEACKTLFVP